MKVDDEWVDYDRFYDRDKGLCQYYVQLIDLFGCLC